MKGEGKTGEGIVCGTVSLHLSFWIQTSVGDENLQHLRYSMSKWVAAQGVEIGLPLQLLLVVSGSVSGIVPKSRMQEVS
jgi:hypothetical protein